MARRILNRKELRNDYDAAERRKDDEEREDEDEEKEEDEDEEEEEDEDEEKDQGDEEQGEGAEEDEDEEAPRKKKPAKVKTPKPRAKPRSRLAKVTRMRVVWGVFNNSNQCVAKFDYPKKSDAVDHAAKLTADKRNTHFVQPIKEAMEEKEKEKEKKEK
jgi:hypothetical protein